MYAILPMEEEKQAMVLREDTFFFLTKPNLLFSPMCFSQISQHLQRNTKKPFSFDHSVLNKSAQTHSTGNYVLFMMCYSAINLLLPCQCPVSNAKGHGPDAIVQM